MSNRSATSPARKATSRSRGRRRCWSAPRACLVSRRSTGLDFGDFLQTDACGPETFDALESAAADVARLCSTDPPIAEQGWVVLEEDEPFTLANEIVPVGREQALTEDMQAVMDAVSAELTTEDLQDFNSRFAGDDPEDAEAIVTEWLEEQGLIE